MLSRREMFATTTAAVIPWTELFAAEPGMPLTDSRLGTPKTLNGYFPFDVPKTKEEWAKRRQRVREQILVATGLWPMPEKTPIEAVVHGQIARDGYTVEKVFFESMPGHVVSGNLYRPTTPNGDKAIKRPAVLVPHGHAKNGRLQEVSDAEVTRDMKSGAEATKESARYPLQASCVGLVRLGFVVFHYDMIGYADSAPIQHVARSGVPAVDGFADAESELRLQSLMGLQTWNSVRALDFVTGLPDVDAKKIGVTGSSGGGTQTMILAAIDDRVQAAFPAVMVSTAMQGGCVCENCSLLRVGTGNIEFAALFAPKPYAMSGADDWTRELMKKGYPELKQLWKLLGAEDNVLAKVWPEFPHNYNQPAREMMYSWFSKHILGKADDIREKPFEPFTPKELSVFDADHPRPKTVLNAAGLRVKMTQAAEKQSATLFPTDAKSGARFREVMSGALRAMICDELPTSIVVKKKPDPKEKSPIERVTLQRAVLGRSDESDALPVTGVYGEKFQEGGSVAIWLHPQGASALRDAKDDARLTTAARSLVDAGFGILAPDVLGVGGLKLARGFVVNNIYAGFTYGYNRSLFAERVHDVLTTIVYAKTVLKAKSIRLVGWEKFGPIAIAARAAAGEIVSHLAADLNQFRFENVKSTDDEMMLPGALKYGGIPALLALSAPYPTLAHNHQGTASGKLTNAAFEAAGAAEQYQRVNLKLPPEKVIDWLIK